MSSSAVTAATVVRNQLLRSLPAEELARLMPDFERADLTLRDRVFEQDATVDAVSFIESGTVSMVTTMLDGMRIEIGLVGREGMVGLPVLMGSVTSSNEAVVQVGGTVLRMRAATFRTALVTAPSLLPLLMRYVDTFQTQVAQSAACNARHSIGQRLARWLIMTHDRVDGDTFDMTQEFMSTMIGVSRPGVTIALSGLRRSGLVTHKQGKMRVLDRRGLEAAACECHAVIDRRYRQLFMTR